MRKLLSGLTLAATALAPAAALAHAGHGEHSGFIHGFLHPIGGLDHILAMVTVGILAYQIGGRALWLGADDLPRRHGRRRPARRRRRVVLLRGTRHRGVGGGARRHRRAGPEAAGRGRDGAGRAVRRLPRLRPRHRSAARRFAAAYGAGFLLATALLHAPASPSACWSAASARRRASSAIASPAARWRSPGCDLSRAVI